MRIAAAMILVPVMALAAEQELARVKLTTGETFDRVYIETTRTGYWVTRDGMRFWYTKAQIAHVEPIRGETDLDKVRRLEVENQTLRNRIRELEEQLAIARKATAGFLRHNTETNRPVSVDQTQGKVPNEERVRQEYLELINEYGEPSPEEKQMIIDLFNQGFTGTLKEAYFRARAATVEAKRQAWAQNQEKQLAAGAGAQPNQPQEAPVRAQGPIVRRVAIIAPSVSTSQAARNLRRLRAWEEVSAKDADHVLVVCRSPLFYPLRTRYESFAALEKDSESQLNIAGTYFHYYLYRMNQDLTLTEVDHTSIEAK